MIRVRCLWYVNIYTRAVLYDNYMLSFSIGINIFLDGFVPTENLRFRETSLTFKVAETADKVLAFLTFL